MTKRLYKLLGCFVLGIFFVSALAFISNRARVAENGFIRKLPSLKLIGENSINVKYNWWYIAGLFDSTIYLGNNILPGRIGKVDREIKNFSLTKITGFDSVKIYNGAYIQIDSPIFYLMDGVKQIILNGNVKDLHLTKQLNATYFTGGIPLTNSTMALRSVYEGIGNRLIKLDLITGQLQPTSLLEKQIDGIFCTDGEIVRVPKSSKIIYVYYYRNQFLCADSNLNLLYKGKTIDTNSHAQIKVAKIKSNSENTLSAPPLYVNKRACANEKYLFVQSALRANNETEYMIKDVSMIDVYAIADGKYQFSFYLPDFRGFKVRDFKVYGQSLYALYDRYLYKYQLNF
nr:hypothetical protein [Pedobacter panaciterrae]